MRKKIAMFGSACDPPTRDHITVAYEAKCQLGVSRVEIVPNRTSPTHDKVIMTDPEIRFRLVRAACIPYNGELVASRIEIDSPIPGPSYTLNTLLEQRRLHGKDALLYFITGADAAGALGGWKGAEDCFKLATFVVAPRGCQPFDRALIREQVKGGYQPILLDACPRSNVSSTIVRDRVRDGLTVRNLVPDVVYWGIKYHGLYLPPGSQTPVGEEALGEEGRWALAFLL